MHNQKHKPQSGTRELSVQECKFVVGGDVGNGTGVNAAGEGTGVYAAGEGTGKA